MWWCQRYLKVHQWNGRCTLTHHGIHEKQVPQYNVIYTILFVYIIIVDIIVHTEPVEDTLSWCSGPHSVYASYIYVRAQPDVLSFVMHIGLPTLFLQCC